MPRTIFPWFAAVLFSFLLFNTNAFAQAAKPVTISISGTEYDSPGLTLLKEYLKTNTKVKNVRSTFSGSIATLSFSYTGDADELWDEVPADRKQAFKISSIDSRNIKLQALKTGTSSQTPGTVKTDSKNCGCDYFPLCKTDKTRSFKGETWKGIDDDGKLTYYHCENGVLRAKKELFDNFEGNSLGFETYTALKYNEPAGTEWKETIDVNGAKYYYTHIISRKGIRISVNGKNYTDVIKVRHIKDGASLFYQGVPQNLMQLENRDIYYVKGVGAFSGRGITELVDEKTEAELNNNTQSPHFNVLTGDTWYNADSKQTFQFNKDGGYKLSREVVAGQPITSEGYWRLKGNWVEITSQKNSPSWYRSVEIIKGAENETQLKQDGRTWIYVQKKTVKPGGNTGTNTNATIAPPAPLIFKTLTQNIWMNDNNMFIMAGFDKSGEYLYSSGTGSEVKQTKGQWRIRDNNIEIQTNRKVDWKKEFEIIKSGDNIKIKNNEGNTFSPYEIPESLRKN